MPVRVLGRIEDALPALYVLVCGPLMIVLATLQPFGHVPDEPTHIVRAESLLHGDIVGHRVTRPHAFDDQPTQVAGTDADEILLPLGWFTLDPRRPTTLAEVQSLLAMRWSGRVVTFGNDNTAVYPPVFYIPGAVGIGIGKLTDRTPAASVLLGRLCNVACVLLLGAIALGRAVKGRALLFCVLAAPISLSIASSSSQDGPLVATVCLAAALLTRPDGGWDRWAAAFCIACVGMAKPPMMAAAGLLLLPFGVNWRRNLAQFGAATAPGLLWTAYAMTFVATSFMRPPYHPGPLFPGSPDVMFRGTDALQQMRVFLADPSRLLTMPIALFRQWGAEYWDEAVGVLGLLSIFLPRPLVTFWHAAYVAAAISLVPRDGSPADVPRWRLRDHALALLFVIVLGLGICDVQYLSWSLVGQERIDGVQGRYFVPLLALLVFVIPGVTIRGARAIRGALAVPALCAAGIGIVAIPLVIVIGNYLG